MSIGQKLEKIRKYHKKNNLTGLLPQKDVSKNGIKLNLYFNKIEKIEQR